jgi:hypothetical protein
MISINKTSIFELFLFSFLSSLAGEIIMGKPFTTWSAVFLPLLGLFDLPLEISSQGKERLAQLFDTLGYVEFYKFSIFLCFYLTKAYYTKLTDETTFQAMLENKELIYAETVDACIDMFNLERFHITPIRDLYSRLI